ncbi:hypothetical protein AAF712_008667 [Marasmius tenuissimus]|uniref:Enamelin n=1 Tax=Marasmius tenuissimus TaxID=585030 RepID=A0ABR2ZRQ7_9AGAR
MSTFFSAAQGINIKGQPYFNHVNGDQTLHHNDRSKHITGSHNTTNTNNYDSYNTSTNHTYKQYKKSDKRKATNNAHFHAYGMDDAHNPFQTNRQQDPGQTSHWPPSSQSAPPLSIADRPFNEAVSADDFMSRPARGKRSKEPWDSSDSDSDSDSGSDGERGYEHADNRARPKQQPFASQAYDDSQYRRNWEDNKAKYRQQAGPDTAWNRPVHAPEPHRGPYPDHSPQPSYGVDESYGWPPHSATQHHPSSSHYPSYSPPDSRYSRDYSYPSRPTDERLHSAAREQQPLAGPSFSQEPWPTPRKPSPSTNPFHQFYQQKNTSAPPSTTTASSPPDSVCGFPNSQDPWSRPGKPSPSESTRAFDSVYLRENTSAAPTTTIPSPPPDSRMMVDG